MRPTPIGPVGRLHGPRTDGTILIVSIWIMLVLAGTILVMARSTRVEGGAAANQAAALQASAIEAGVIQYVLARVDGLDGRMPSAGEMPCEGVLLGDGAFWILRGGDASDVRQSFGLVSEAGKINLNTAPVDVLAELPNMTTELAAAIVDWRDSDSDLTPGGAEREYYLLLPEPYECKNAPLETVAEVLLVAGADEDLLLAEDAAATNGADIPGGYLDRGLYACATVYSIEPNADASGRARVNVNEMQNVADLLADALGEPRALEVMVLARRERPFANTLDFYLRTELTEAEFNALGDRITTTSDEEIHGLVDLRTASEEVLAALPGLDNTDVAALLNSRPPADAEPAGIGWVAGVLSPDKAVAIGSHITDRSYQFSADIVSVSGDGRAFKRCRIVVDARRGAPRVVYRQDLTARGWPLHEEILRQLRQGTPIERVVAGEYEDYVR